MAIETSILNDNDLEELLRKKYQVKKIYETSTLEGGISNCKKILCENGNFVLKEFPSTFSIDDIEREPQLTSFLGANVIPVADFISPVDGAYVWTYKNRYFHLQKYVEGVIFKRNTAPEWFLKEAPMLLGKIHLVLERFPKLNDGMGKDYFSSWSLQDAQKDFLNLIQAVEVDENLKDKRVILADLKFKYSHLPEIYRIDFDFDRLTFKNTHGDYKIYNLICNDQSVAAIIDFSSACVHPIIWEIMRSYLHADPYCIDGNIHINNLKEYTKLYLKYGTLTEYDLKMIPYLFYYQQVRANYYNEFYYGHETHKKGALDIAQWSTNICRWLAINKDELSNELVKLF